jgi:hypothetical protein
MPDQTLTRGDVWESVYHIGPMEDELAQPPAPPCLSCRLQFRDRTTGALGYELLSTVVDGKGLITIVDSVNYEFDIAEQILPLKVGTFDWDFETFETADYTLPSRTWLTGTFNIIKDISR